MKKSLAIVLLLLSVRGLSAQDVSGNSSRDSLETSGTRVFKETVFPPGEMHYRQVLARDPENVEANEAIIGYYWEGHNSVPIMALTLLNIIDPESSDAKRRIKNINFLYHRYLSFNSGGTSVHVAPKFVAEWDAGYENNVSPLEAGFTYAGAIDYAPEEKNLNSAERMIKKFELVFSKVPNFRSKYHGTYWDVYVDYFTKLYQSDHFRTAMYVVMGKSNEKEIKEWLRNNPDKIETFRAWHDVNIGLLSAE